MSNLGTFEIDTKGEYINIEEIIGELLLEDSSYILQNVGGDVITLCEADEPNGGNKLAPLDCFKYKKETTPLFIKTSQSGSKLDIASV